MSICHQRGERCTWPFHWDDGRPYCDECGFYRSDVARRERVDCNKCAACGDIAEEWWNYCAMCGYHIAGAGPAQEDALMPPTLNDLAAAEAYIKRLEAENKRLRGALAAIQKATIEGRVCDDVAWFDTITTMYDFCADVLEQSETKEG